MTNAAIVVSIEVAADPQLAFEVFTADIDSWWLRGPQHRFRAPWDGRLRFEPIDGGTRVSVEHRGWDALRAGHPARHGESGRDFAYRRAELWAKNLTSLRRHFELRARAQPPASAGKTRR